jgi:hypothetical protein
MIDEEYRGYNLTAVRRRGLWQVSIYPLSVGQIVPKPRGRQAAQAVAREEALSKRAAALMPCLRRDRFETWCMAIHFCCPTC